MKIIISADYVRAHMQSVMRKQKSSDMWSVSPRLSTKGLEKLETGVHKLSNATMLLKPEM
jgi:hypothetical protein